VEWAVARLGHCRRLASDFESLVVNALGLLPLVAIRLVQRRLKIGSDHPWIYRMESKWLLGRGRLRGGVSNEALPVGRRTAD
jgi:hypothetical protein